MNLSVLTSPGSITILVYLDEKRETGLSMQELKDGIRQNKAEIESSIGYLIKHGLIKSLPWGSSDHVVPLLPLFPRFKTTKKGRKAVKHLRKFLDIFRSVDKRL